MLPKQLLLDGFLPADDLNVSLWASKKESSDDDDSLDENKRNTPSQPLDLGGKPDTDASQDTDSSDPINEALEPEPQDSSESELLDTVNPEDGEDASEAENSTGVQPAQSTSRIRADGDNAERSDVLSPDPPKHSHKKPRIVAMITVILLIVLAVVSGSFYFKDRAMPNSFVAGENVSYMTRSEVANVVENKQKTIKITFIGNEKDKLHLATHDNVGLKFDTEKTVDSALSLHRTGDVLDKIKLWEHQNVNLEPRIDSKALKSYIKKEIKSSSRAPVSARINFDTKSEKYVVQKDKDGSGILVEQAVRELRDSASRGESVKIAVPTQAIPADIQAEALSDDTQSANSYIATDVKITITGTDIHPSRSEKASWLKLKLNNGKHYTIEIREDLIKQYVANVVSPYQQETKEQISIKDKKTKKITVLQAGANGRSVDNQTEITTNLISAFREKQAYAGEARVTSTKFKNKDLNSFPKWALVILSEQRLTAYEYAKPVKSFTISSGVPQYPSDTGVFKVWHKTAVQTMTGGSLVGGDYYNLPNVHWNTYYNGDEAVHEAYWHNNFGTPMSHGCLNSRLADAKWFYDFAPIGTTVVVLP